tara:strand:+ start:612 stop:917 length:306 start_codon:yes stop_codon:yes gene_type:complete
MRRTASSVLRDLEIRVARLENKRALHDDRSLSKLRKKIEDSFLTNEEKKQLLLAFDRSVLKYKANSLHNQANALKTDDRMVSQALSNLAEREIEQLITFFP